MNPSPQLFIRVLSTALCVIGIGSSAAAQSGSSKLDKFLRAAQQRGSVQRVIIQARPGSRASLKQALRQHGDIIRAEHAGLDALTVDLHAEDLAALAADPTVLAISVDAEVAAFGAKLDRNRHEPRRSKPQPAPQDRQVELLRETVGVAGSPFSGVGVHVAILDSGIEPNRDLADKIAGFWDFTRGGVATTPSDEYGHGTHVAGLIASSGIESKREFVGIAPGVRLYAFKVLDKDGRGRASDVVRALEFIVASKKSTVPNAIKIDIVNLSLGHPIYEPAETDPLVRAVESAVRAGITVVTAAGNFGATKNGGTGYAGIMSPGNAPSAITVGAVDTKGTVGIGDDRVASFSSRGPTWFDGLAKPDIVAPGVNLTSDAPRFSSLFEAYPELLRVTKSGKGNFGSLSGTSMAAAVATGVSSVVLQASRTANFGKALSPAALKAVLQYTALPLEDAAASPYDALTQGTGSINARGAVVMALVINTTMPAGTAWLRLNPEPITIIDGSRLRWSQALLWDDNIVWGTDALAFNSIQWADNIVWGTAFESDDNIVWGTAAEFDNIVWGTAAEWTTDLVWPNRVIGLAVDADNIVWGTALGLDEDNIVWGTLDGDNIVWGTWDNDNIVWGTTALDNIVWGTVADLDNIVWGTLADDDNIVWGTRAGR
ncbi:MAG: S8 family serine peptidase [Vicinamibacterales bacterium]